MPLPAGSAPQDDGEFAPRPGIGRVDGEQVTQHGFACLDGVLRGVIPHPDGAELMQGAMVWKAGGKRVEMLLYGGRAGSLCKKVGNGPVRGHVEGGMLQQFAPPVKRQCRLPTFVRERGGSAQPVGVCGVVSARFQ